MNRKLNPADKGKGLAVKASEAPRRARVRVQEPDLLRKHSLTLIGKVTNPSVQKVHSLIPFFTKHWKTKKIRTVGSDLGQGLFQFQFDSESDLLAVLEQRPFHFAKWMVILQRWEPTASPSFPSLIPFWIKVEGIPAHLWTEETIRSIGEDIGHFECLNISTVSVRMRVHVNGRLPLIKSSVIEYPNGDEVTASLIYEKLEKHCSHCYRLDHELKDCLAAKHQKKKANALALALSEEEEESSYGKRKINLEEEKKNTKSRTNGSEAHVNNAVAAQAGVVSLTRELFATLASFRASHSSNNPNCTSGMVRGNTQYQCQQYQPEASVQNQNYGPVPSYQQANYHHGVTTNQGHHILNISQFQAGIMRPSAEKESLEPQGLAAQLQPMRSGDGDVEKEERYQRTLQFAVSLLQQIKQNQDRGLEASLHSPS